MNPPSLAAALEKISNDRRRAIVHQRMVWIWAALSVSLLIYLFGVRQFDWNAPFFVPTIIALGIGAWFVVKASVRRMEWSLLDVARDVEAGDARLNSLLLAAYEEQQRAGSEGLGYLQERVILEALEANRRSPWGKQFEERRFLKGVRHGLSFAAFFVAMVLTLVMGPRGTILTAILGGVTVSPGTAAVERGTAVAVMAKFPEPAPAEVQLLVKPKDGPLRTVRMERALQDPTFGASFPEVLEDFSYQVEYKGKKTPEYKITTFEFPVLKRADAALKYPEFTGLGDKRIEDTRRVSAVEGTKVDYRFELNKPVKSATLVSKTGTSVPLVKDEKFPNVYHATFDLTESMKLALALKDEDGRTNKAAHEFTLEAMANKPPDLKIQFPRGDQRVSAIEEVSLQAQASDDFGLGEYGLAYSIGGDEPKYIKLGEKANANEKKAMQHLLRVEEMGAETDQLISYFAWAEDRGPDGKMRRSESDMYFAEVRPFDEIFRKGNESQQQQQQQGGQQGGQQSQSEKLSELQKNIINATWKLQRDEAVKHSPKFKDDVTVVKDSQDKALEQATALSDKIDDPKMKAFAEAATKEMKKALGNLEDAASKKNAEPLPPALSAERAAYQALLRLQAREYSVSRQRGGGGGGQRSQMAQRQLDELDLDQEKNRYETQSQASAQKSQEQQEQQQVLNRLKELSRRQQDINERLKELQAALQEAKTQQEKEDLQRRLKRLREEQQDAVQDMDELQQKMAQSQNQSQMGEARQQLEQARQQAQKAGEQMAENSLGQAASAGARTEKDLKKVTEDFRKATAQQFNDEMRDMRRQARDLAEKEKQIADQIGEMKNPKQRTLSDAGGKDELAKGLNQQKTNYANILDRMKKVSEQAETVEPLLSQKLYDTVRELNQATTEKDLDTASEFLRRSFVPQASQLEEKARKSIDQLREGVDQAASRLLGDESQALRTAARELDDLARRLQNEAAAGMRGTNGAPGMAANGERGTNQVAGVGRNGTNQLAFMPIQGTNAGGRRLPNDLRYRAQGQRAQRGQNGEQQQGEQGQNGEQQGDQQGGQQQASNQPGQRGQRGQQGQQPGGQQGQQGQQGQGGQQQANNDGQGGGRQNGDPRQQANNNGGRRNFFDGGGGAGRNVKNDFEGGDWGGSGPNSEEGPITGRNFQQWSDRLRDVQEMIDDPDLRNEVAQALDRARDMRSEFRRHSKPPEWAVVQSSVVGPLMEVRQRIAEELARREASTVAPLDRDPVPGRYSELVSRYYQSLGQGAPAPKQPAPTAQ